MKINGQNQVGIIRFDKLKHLGIFQDHNDKTIKSVYKARQGVIETTFINNKFDRGSDVYCVPTHHYCSLGCVMCHLTKEGMHKSMVQIQKENLIESLFRTNFRGCKGGILDYGKVYSLDKGLYDLSLKRSQNKKRWISYMGVGEPLLNLRLLQSVFEAEQMIKDACGYEELTYALATMMPNKNLETFTDYACDNKLPMKVHFSMHSPFSEERFKLLPKTKVAVEEALSMLVEYRKRTLRVKEIKKNMLSFHPIADPTEIHYTLIKGVNDSGKHLEKLTELLIENRIPIKFIRFNPVCGMGVSKKEEEWVDALRQQIHGLKIVRYIPPGGQIGSSCGEFTKHYYLSELETTEEQREFYEWKKRHEIKE